MKGHKANPTSQSKYVKREKNGYDDSPNAGV